MPKNAIVTDLIYAPLETNLLATATYAWVADGRRSQNVAPSGGTRVSLLFGGAAQVTSALRASVDVDLAKS